MSYWPCGTQAWLFVSIGIMPYY